MTLYDYSYQRFLKRKKVPFHVPLFDLDPTGDGLKDILNDALVNSEVEVIKFNRGDYVDA